MKTLIEILLVAIALYTGGAWAFSAWGFYANGGKTWPIELRERYNTAMFYLGLCCILSLGFLGLMLEA